ncbi:peptide mating pheromone Bbp2-1 [Aspergillus fumigatus Z5]|nr:peptide mating pheromone Bbp2-1 [Aspergillus fumigatus Z5]
MMSQLSMVDHVELKDSMIGKCLVRDHPHGDDDDCRWVRQSSTGMAVSKDRQASSWQFGTNLAVAQCPEEWSINDCSLWSRYECIEASLVLNCISPGKVWALTFVADCYSIRPTVYMLLPSASNDKFSIIALTFIGSALAAPGASIPTPSTPAAPSCAASSSHIASSTASPSATPIFQPGCDIEHVGNNGKHLGWCKKARHYGIYNNGTSI